ncbi:MAG: sigma-70 family RNA polymerase sigma factor, partial [Terriglobia bacterium]
MKLQASHRAVDGDSARRRPRAPIERRSRYLWARRSEITSQRDAATISADPAIEECFKCELLALVPHLRAFAQSLTGDRTSADDLAQEALTRAWAGRDSYKMGTNMKAWIFRILRNQFYSEKRQSWRQTQLDSETAEGTLVAVDDPQAKVALDELRMGLAMLTVEQREALILVGAGGFGYEEVAEICG